MERFMTVGTAAAEAGLSSSMVRYLCDVGKLPCIRAGRWYRLIPMRAVRRLKRERQAKRAEESVQEQTG